MTAVLTSVLAVFTAIGEWIPDAIQNLIPMFYQTGENAGLTFLGVLSVAGLAFSVIFLIIGLNYMGPLSSDIELKTALTAGTAL